MKAGNYAIVEHEAPDGTILSKENLDFSIDKNAVHEVAVHGRAIQTVQFSNLAPALQLSITKNFEEQESPTTKLEAGFEIRIKDE